jgi:hypothetical protein
MHTKQPQIFGQESWMIVVHCAAHREYLGAQRLLQQEIL